MTSKRDIRCLHKHKHKPAAAQRITVAISTWSCKRSPGACLKHPVYPSSRDVAPLPHITGLDVQLPSPRLAAAALVGAGLEEHLLSW